MTMRVLSSILAIVILAALATSASGATLPDNRAYELVTRYEENGHEAGMNGAETGFGVPSLDGGAVDWEALGACCGTTTAAVNFYQSYRRANGWQTKALTPKPSVQLYGLYEEQAPMFWTPDLQQTIFATPASYAPGARRPLMSDSNDLYLEGPTGALNWLSQGPSGTGEGSYGAEFDGATPDASKVVFSSAEALTPNATGAEPTYPPAQYLYMRDVAHGTTTLLDVNNSNELLGVTGATLGNGNWLNEDLIPSNYEGTTTNAISQDGTKAFFETPSSARGESHLYMRDLANNTTTPIDEPAGVGKARYEGASADGALVFFTSNEGLSGAPKSLQLYAFNTTAAPIGPLPPMSAMPISLGNSGTQPTTTLTAEAPSGASTLSVASTTGFIAGREITIEGESVKIKAVLGAGELELARGLGASFPAGTTVTQQRDAALGESAIANDGSRVFFVSDEVLATNPNPVGRTALENQPNLYIYETHTGNTTFLTTLASVDVSSCDPNCSYNFASALVAQPDVARPAYPSPDGSVFVFESTGDLTGQDAAPETRLTAMGNFDDQTINVESTAGFLPHHVIEIDSGPAQELVTIQSVDSPTQITLTEYNPAGGLGLGAEHAVGAVVRQPDVEVYRYAQGEDSLTCISCAPAGQSPTGSAGMNSGGGSYAPPGQTVSMTSDGSRIFFESPNALLPGVQSAPASSGTEPRNVYEWEGGKLSLISDGSTAGFALDGTTPSGNDVFLGTRKQLTSSETGGYEEVYDARVGGGFAPPPASPAPCTAQECRTASGATVFFSPPASAIIGAAGALRGGITAPSFSIASITARQRTRLARSGALTLSVIGTAPGKIDAIAVARVRGRSRRVANATVTLTKAGAISVSLHLSRSAIAALAAKKTLTVRLEVSYSASPTVKLAVLTLHAPTIGAGAARRHRSHG